MNATPDRYFAIVPAAGSGSRMASDVPKQYLAINGRPMLWHTLARLLQVVRIEQLLLVLSPDDVHWGALQEHWQALNAGDRLQVLRVGGATRADSVRHALQYLQDVLREDDWVLVHDAARACIRAEQVNTMMNTLNEDAVGGLLALPVADTLKRADAAGRVQQTVARDGMWQAQTPQMFRYALLNKALHANPGLTDEAGAIEAMGFAPVLVAGDASNFKITYANDLSLAAYILAAQNAAPGDSCLGSKL